MKRRVAIAAVVLGLAALVWFVPTGQTQPTYKGRPASYWLAQFIPGSTNSDEAARAFNAMGSNAMPCIIENLHARDSVVRAKAHTLARRYSLNAFSYTPASMRRFCALTALNHVGPACSGAAVEMEYLFDTPYGGYACEALSRMGGEGLWPLAKALNSTNQVTRAIARFRLEYSHADTGAQLAILGAKLNDLSPETRRTAARALGTLHGLRTNAVLVLEPHLNDTDLATRRFVVTNICKTGTRGTVVPLMHRALTNSDGIVRAAATNALEQLDALPR
jgi:hypothetical protein